MEIAESWRKYMGRKTYDVGLVKSNKGRVIKFLLFLLELLNNVKKFDA